jgi:hypothetical protein
LYIEVANGYGFPYDLTKQELDLGQIIDFVTDTAAKVAKTREGELKRSVKIELSIGAQAEGQSLIIFIAQSTSPSILKIAVEVESS